MARSIKVGKELWERIERAAKAGGYSSPQEVAEHVLDKYVPRSEETDSKEEILKKLKGLLVANARLVGLLLVPLVILSVPMAPLFFCLDGFYGLLNLRFFAPREDPAALAGGVGSPAWIAPG